MNGKPLHPILVVLTSHWLSFAGTTLVTTAVISWLLVLGLQSRATHSNPYVGIILFAVVPAVFFAGLAMIPAGVGLAKRRVRAGLAAELDPRAAWQRVVVFLGVTTVLNLIIGTQFTYGAVEYMETVEFCGQTCHVMTPEFTSHLNAPHAQVACAECHMGPGVSGWLHAKWNGTRQLMEVVFDSYPRPIESALASDRLVPSKLTCERCHSSQKAADVRVRVIPHFAQDEKNTATRTVLTMMIGGGSAAGIHGAHYGPGVEIRYAAEGKREAIPWVEYRNTTTGQVRTYSASSKGAPDPGRLPRYTMQCVDCHNRPTHTFEPPERALDQALAAGEVDSTLPFVKKQALALLNRQYASSEEAARLLPLALRTYYEKAQPVLLTSRSADIEKSGKALASLYNRNVFPDLKVTWGTYPNHLGHTDYPGCFRCHDDAHATADGKTITQDCKTCHELVAVEEPAPDVLKTLGVAERFTELRKPH